MSISRGLRYAIMERDGHTCQYCGGKAPNVELEIDHIVPRSAGGTEDPDNLLTACKDCNTGKGKSVKRPQIDNAALRATLEKLTERRLLLDQIGAEQAIIAKHRAATHLRVVNYWLNACGYLTIDTLDTLNDKYRTDAMCWRRQLIFHSEDDIAKSIDIAVARLNPNLDPTDVMRYAFGVLKIERKKRE